MLPDAVKTYLDTHREQHLAKLFELLRFPSIANDPGDPDQCQACAEWLVAHLQGLGFTAEVAPTAGRPAVLGELHVGDDRPTVLIYNHYDVQPPDPLELWDSGPFEPEIRDGRIYARGANDDKGQMFCQLAALEAHLRGGEGLGVNVKVLFEGEEEIGSPTLEPFLRANADRFAADAAVISDVEFFAQGHPSITYALRGLAYFEITLIGPDHDCHSGMHGGALANPTNAIARLVASMHDEAGRVTIPGFYDDVLPLTDAERQAWAQLPFDEAGYAAELGVEELAGGEAGLGILERRWARPTLDCNGIFGGYAGEGAKTIIPSRAGAKISCRLVAEQDPDKITEGMRQFLAANTPAGMRAELEVHAGARPVLVDTAQPAIQAAREALKESFEADVALVRAGASVPVTELFQRILGLDAVLMGFGLPNDNLHAPNEKFDLDQFHRGCHAAAAFLHNLATTV